MPQLTWLGDSDARRSAQRVSYRVLSTVETIGDPTVENLLIQGDNLDALKALLPFYAGRVKCVFIDPPYNTQSAFAHYDDKLEHSQWLSMMYPRLVLLRDLLATDGSLWVTIDDNESHYLKVLLDEVFGRANFVANVVWEKKSSPQSNATWLSDSHDHVLVYARSKELWRPNKLDRTAAMDSIYKKSDEFDGIDENGNTYGRGPWFPGDFTLSLASGQRGKQYAKTGESNNLYEIVTPSGRKVLPASGRAWAYTKESYERLLADNRVWFGKKGNNKPTIKRFLSEIAAKGVVATTNWSYEDVGENRIAAQELKKLGVQGSFSTPKPEALMRRIIQLSTSPGDLVLDSFLGSGTTAAVAHKMSRRWIGIEMGDHANTICAPRLKKVVEGEQGGVSESVHWTGGGGFRFMKLGKKAFLDDGTLDPAIRFNELAAYIWFLETRTPHSSRKFKSPFLGIHDGTAYALLYNGVLGDKRPEGGNVLTTATWNDVRRLLPDDRRNAVIYGAACRLSPTRLKAARISFKQIPYDIAMR